MCDYKNPEFDWEDFNQRKRLEESSQEAQEKKKLIIAKVNKIAEENKLNVREWEYTRLGNVFSLKFIFEPKEEKIKIDELIEEYKGEEMSKLEDLLEQLKITIRVGDRYKKLIPYDHFGVFDKTTYMYGVYIKNKNQEIKLLDEIDKLNERS